MAGRGRWREVGEAPERNIIKSRKDGGQVVAYRNLQPAAAFNDAESRRYFRPGFFISQMDPVAAPQSHGTRGVLRQVVAQLQIRVIGKVSEG